MWAEAALMYRYGIRTLRTVQIIYKFICIAIWTVFYLKNPPLFCCQLCPFFYRREIDHFLAQSYIESYFGWALIEVNWETGYNNQDEAVNREYFNEKYAYAVGNQGGEDGYTYRGAGYIQLTGRYNYTRFSKDLGDERILEEGADYVAEKYAWEAAGWYWKTYVQHLFDDGNTPTVKEVTQEINSKEKDSSKRIDIYNKLTEME